MDITFFHWNEGMGPSIVKSFRPLIDHLSETDNVREFRVPYMGSNPVKMIKNILFVHRHRDPHGINHITGDIHYCILGLLGVPSVLTIHDDYAVSHAKRGPLDKAFKWLFWMWLPIKLADRVVCISRATKEKIDRLVRNKKTVVIANHALGGEFKYVPREFNASRPAVLQVGAFHSKNLETTIRALQGLPCKLTVIKIMTESQRELARACGVECTNLYDLTNEQVVDQYAAADIIAFPSSYEGFGLPIIEGQAVGRIVITTDRPPMNDVAGGAALLLQDPLDPAEMRRAIDTAINDPALRNELIARGLQNVKRFTVEAASQRYLALYSGLICN